VRNSHLIGFAEVKGCGYEFRFPNKAGWTTGARKVDEAKDVGRILCVPVWFAVPFACGIVGLIDVRHDYIEIPNFGRLDRGDERDLERGARFQWGRFVVLSGRWK